MMCLKDLRILGNADDAFYLSFVSQSAAHLGSVGNPPPLLLPSLLTSLFSLLNLRPALWP